MQSMRSFESSSIEKKEFRFSKWRSLSHIFSNNMVIDISHTSFPRHLDWGAISPWSRSGTGIVGRGTDLFRLCLKKCFGMWVMVIVKGSVENPVVVVPVFQMVELGSFVVMSVQSVHFRFNFRSERGFPSHVFRNCPVIDISVTSVPRNAHWYGWCVWSGTVGVVNRSRNSDILGTKSVFSEFTFRSNRFNLSN